MNGSIGNDIIISAIEKNNLGYITEYASICNPGKPTVTVCRYNGNGVRLVKEDGHPKLFIPNNITTVQEGHVANAIANGTIFDDADDIDANATMIEKTTLPCNAMINSGKDLPKAVKPMVAIVIGKMNDNGEFAVSDTDRTNGVNLIKDLTSDKPAYDVISNYVGSPDDEYLDPDIRKDMPQLAKDINNIKSTDIDDTISTDDEVDSYDDYDMDEIESDIGGDEKTDDDENTDADDDTDDDAVEEKDDSYLESDETVVADDDNTGDQTTSTDAPPADTPSESVVEEGELQNCLPDGSVNHDALPMSAQTKAIVQSKYGNQTMQEGFLSKKPKKLKPIPRDIIAYITIEMNDIHSANDQAMLSGYTCSKIELVDFYITVLDTNDARYIVPHNKQYLEWMKKELERLLAQILKIRPINRSEQIWRVNYPTP